MKNKNISQFNNAIKWININTIGGNGIVVHSNERVIYPEVTGYYIPTLLQWGERKLAISYAKYLCSIQKDDGSWYDSKDKDPYVFDSAQILKGLIAVRDIIPEVDSHIIRGCDWILSCMQADGRLVTPSKDEWVDDEEYCSDLIHIYCLSPIKDAGRIFEKTEYLSAVDKILSFYKTQKIDRIKNFSLLSHFYAYVLEGLFDLDEIELCREAMDNLMKYQNYKGGIPGLKNVSWICSTGLFQLAVVWYKLGELDKGDVFFDYALKLQNKSGGWYGSYPALGICSLFPFGRNKPTYFQDSEISWAVKYFLDALALKQKLDFEKQFSSFLDIIDKNDGRYKLVYGIVDTLNNDKSISICDVGCGKGRYLKNLKSDFPNNDYYAFDISFNVMQDIDYVNEKRIGSMTHISYEDCKFDLVYACESFEHSINLKTAFSELYRITKPGGKIIILDKPIEKLGQLKIDEWEQWISDEDVKVFTHELGGSLDIIKSVSYENKNDGLFRAWIINKSDK